MRGLLFASLLLFDFMAQAAPCPASAPALEHLQKRQSEAGYSPYRLTQWKRSEAPRAKAIVVHGLNYNPEKMGNLVLFLNEQGIDSLKVTLSGHGETREEFKSVTADRWLNDYHTAQCIAQNDERTRNMPLYFVGYSLGAAVGVVAHLENTDFETEKMILISPALSLTRLSRLVQLFFWWRTLVLPSKAHKDFRAHPGTPIAAYRALFDLVGRVERAGNPDSLRRPTLVLVDKDDELVSNDGLKKLINQHKLSSWVHKEIEVAPSKLSPAPHHAAIDPFFTGIPLWREITDEMRGFLARETGTAKSL